MSPQWRSHLCAFRTLVNIEGLQQRDPAQRSDDQPTAPKRRSNVATSPNAFFADSFLETLAERIAQKLRVEPRDLQPRLLTIDQAAVYVGRTREAMQHLANSARIPTVRADRRVFIDRRDLDRWIDLNKSAVSV